MFVEDIKRFLKDNEGNEEEMIKKVAPNEEIDSLMKTILNIMNIQKNVEGGLAQW